MKKPINIKDKEAEKYILHLESQLNTFNQSPYLKHYLTILNQINDWSDQLQLREAVVDGQKVMKGRIEIFGSKDDKEFDRTLKYFNEIEGYLTKLDNLRKKMQPEDLDVLRKKIKEDNMSVAEILATNGARKS